MPEAVKSERLARLQALLASQTQEFNASMLGRTVDVLLDKPGRKPGQLGGRSPWLQAVHIEAPETLLGSIHTVLIEEIRTSSMVGRLVEAGTAPLAKAEVRAEDKVMRHSTGGVC